MRVEARAVERCLLAGTLDLDEAALAVHHHVHVDLGDRVLGVVQVEQELAIDHAHAGRGHLSEQRDRRDLAGIPPRGQRVVQRDAGAGDRRGARAAVGLDDVAVDGHGDLAAETAEIDDGAQRPADEPLDLVGAALGARHRSRGATRVCVEAGSIAYSAVTQPRPEPRRHELTPSSTDAAHSTRVSPSSKMQLPWRA